MDRGSFDKLDLKSQVEYINKRLALGESLRIISDNIGIQKKTIRDRFKKINYEFNKESNRYICTIFILQESVKEDFFQLIEAKEELFKVIEWFKKQQCEDKIIEIPELKIYKDKLKGEVKVTTIRVYSEIKNKFQEFIRKFPEYKSQDLYSQALVEFMMKYDK